MALTRFRFPDSSPSYTPEFPQGAALNHEPPALPLSYAGPYAGFYGMSGDRRQTFVDSIRASEHDLILSEAPSVDHAR